MSKGRRLVCALSLGGLLNPLSDALSKYSDLRQKLLVDLVLLYVLQQPISTAAYFALTFRLKSIDENEEFAAI